MTNFQYANISFLENNKPIVQSEGDIILSIYNTAVSCVKDITSVVYFEISNNDKHEKVCSFTDRFNHSSVIAIDVPDDKIDEIQNELNKNITTHVFVKVPFQKTKSYAKTNIPGIKKLIVFENERLLLFGFKKDLRE